MLCLFFPPGQEFYIIINLAVGGTAGASVSVSVSLPLLLLVFIAVSVTNTQSVLHFLFPTSMCICVQGTSPMVWVASRGPTPAPTQVGGALGTERAPSSLLTLHSLLLESREGLFAVHPPSPSPPLSSLPPPPRPVNEFYNAEGAWLPTWQKGPGSSALQVDYVKVWSL